jgi:hypothetical protein
MRHIRPAVVVLATLATAACLGVDPTPNQKIGLVTLRAFNSGGDDVLRGTAVFYRIAGLQVGRAQPQFCANFAYSAAADVPSGVGGPTTMDAGLSLLFTTRGGSESALRNTVGSFLNYNFPASIGVPQVANDTVTVSIPGALGGFEPMTIRMPVADAFTATDPALDYVENEDLTVNWTPPANPGSVMVVALRFSNNPDVLEPNIELACSFVDNGSGVIPAQSLNNWSQSAPASRSFVFLRLRDTIVNFDERVLARLTSQYEVPRPPLP